MSITDDQIRGIAHLARVAISPEELPGYCENMSNILNFIEQMNAIDTTGVEPLAHPFATYQRTRPDSVTESNQREALLALSEQSEQGLYLVPKVIE
jgi:aspartyl-tRNA(Asn)/glutamyl-tRNA(Gln) amidotransferase subunit C